MYPNPLRQSQPAKPPSLSCAIYGVSTPHETSSCSLCYHDCLPTFSACRAPLEPHASHSFIYFYSTTFLYPKTYLAVRAHRRLRESFNGPIAIVSPNYPITLIATPCSISTHDQDVMGASAHLARRGEAEKPSRID